MIKISLFYTYMWFKNISARLKSKWQSLFAQRPSPKFVGAGVLGVILLVMLINLAMLWYYHDHYYPNTYVGGTKVSGMTESRARQVLVDLTDRQPLIIAIKNKVVKIPTRELGVTYDVQASIEKLNQLRTPAIPMMAWVNSGQESTVDLTYSIDQEKFSNRVSRLLQEYTAEPRNAKLEIKDGNAEIVSHDSGVAFDQDKVSEEIKRGLTKLANDPVKISINEVAVEVTNQDLQPALESAKQKLSTKITLTYKDKSFSPTRTQIGSWLEVVENLKLQVSEESVAGYVEEVAEEIDIPVKNEVVTTMDGVETDRQPGESGLSLNRAEVIKKIIDALQKKEQLTYELKMMTVEPIVEYVRKYTFKGYTYNYCVQANSVSGDMLGHFSQKIKSTLADHRGWSMGGQIVFNEVGSGCNFNLVLAAAHTLPHYSSGCSIYWSCRVGSNVIINVDRWLGASESWNNAGGSLGEYQAMVINHEVGHWLGFDHWSCGGSGQQAPVMLQQSINLYGCTFNAWPSQAELNSLRAMKGI